MERKNLRNLTRGDLTSLTWDNLKADLNLRLVELQRENDNDLDEKATARVRGRIAEIKSILALDQPDPATGHAFDTN